MDRKRDVVTGIGFVLILMGFLFWCLLEPDRVFSGNENRNLQGLPAWSLSAVASGQYMKAFEAYASDHMAVRDEWVKLKNRTDMTMGKKDNGSVYFGAEGYLFPIESLDQKQLKKNEGYVAAFEKKLAEAGRPLNFSLLIAPTGEVVYRDLLPQYAPTSNQEVLLQQLAADFGNQLTDPTSQLTAHKGEYLYYRTDHHWTTLGAYYAYRAWAETVQLEPLKRADLKAETVAKDFYGTTYSKAAGYPVQPDRIETLAPEEETSPAMVIQTAEGEKQFDSLYDASYLSTKDKYAYFLSGNNPLTTVAGTAHNGRRMLVIKDSYANCFVPFLTAHFDEIYVADPRYYKESLLKLAEDKQITDVLFLYNLVQFSNDRNLVYLLKE
ncbi:hypothetical protein Ami103574_13505 [Aminipila butyrica]|uniref:DHHW protein n=1 Tax=Aminipila butyrica TaxID=433296 RepID=A0A858BYN9_9FIRM|nr:DHHW family protein [Aminipila butyrica]QIB70245.1 hypothetical protein Ami103574_13505 [Aminipila butyrica]